MRGNLKVREPEILKKWDGMDAYQKLRELRRGKERFILHDGPPYSNGHIHLGTAVNKTIKDFIVRSHSMMGYDAPFVPGWDNHGMPIENNVTRELKRHRRDFSKVELRERCREYAKKFIDIQREEFMRLGGWGSWSDPYLTMSYDYESKILRVFGELVDKGFICRGLRPIHWCISKSCTTALAEAEIEHRDKISHSIVVRFPLIKDPNQIFGDESPEKCYVLIWTTTPWTIPANMAVAVHREFNYSLIKTKAGDVYLLATDRVGPVMEMIKTDEVDEIKRVPGRELKSLVFKHPYFDRESPILFGDHVTLSDGTGVVHTAPGHGAEDFELGMKENISIFCPVDESGRFTKDAEKYEGMTVFDGNKVVIKDLQDNGSLLHYERITHSYPHCWRCHKPVIFRTTTQWFMSIDHNSLRKKSIEEIKKVAWVPKTSINRITAMVENRPDWCLSRQRMWGVGIPAFYCTDCGEMNMTKKSIDHAADLVAEKGSDIWFEAAPEDLLPHDYVCSKCGGKNFRKESDILDVWFDSGSTHRAVLEEREELDWPCDVYFEGSDQHRGWFNSSLMIAVATKDAAPYRQVITHGWTLDEKGKAMHKSHGNVVSPLKLIDKFGADLLRLWIASTDFRPDMSYSERNMKRVSDAYRRIRNTFRFILGNLSDFDPTLHQVKASDMREFDLWILHRAQKFLEKQVDRYKNYDYHELYQDVHNFFAIDLSALYLDMVKDRLYCDGKSSISRRSAQTAMYLIGKSLLTVIAPVLVFTSEEAWGYFPKIESDPESVHFLEFVQPGKSFINPELSERWERLLKARAGVTKVLEEARSKKKIGHSLDAIVYIRPKSDDLKKFLEEYQEELPMLFITSQAAIVDEKVPSDFLLDDEDAEFFVQSALGKKCERCWQYSEDVGSFPDHQTICGRCYRVMTEEMGE